MVVAVVVALGKADVIEDIEFRFGPEIRGVGDAAGLQVGLGLDRDLPRVAGVHLAGHGVFDVADEHQRRRHRKGVHEGGVRVGHQQHVAFLDLLEATDAGSVEAEALFEGVGGKLFGGDRKVLPKPRQVDESHVHHLDLLLLDELHDIVRFHRHLASLFTVNGPGPHREPRRPRCAGTASYTTSLSPGRIF